MLRDVPVRNIQETRWLPNEVEFQRTDEPAGSGCVVVVVVAGEQLRGVLLDSPWLRPPAVRVRCRRAGASRGHICLILAEVVAAPPTARRPPRARGSRRFSRRTRARRTTTRAATCVARSEAPGYYVIVRWKSRDRNGALFSIDSHLIDRFLIRRAKSTGGEGCWRTLFLLAAPPRRTFLSRSLGRCRS